MQLSSTSISSSKRKDFGQKSGTRIQTKHKRLDAICEKEYNRNHGEGNEGNGVGGSESVDLELRRSSRVRRAPVILDVSPPPPKKRRKIGKNGRFGPDRRRLGSVKEEEGEEETRDVQTLGSWRSRLRTRARNVSVKVKAEERVFPSRRKLFEHIGGSEEEQEEQEEGELDVGEMMVVKSKRPWRIKAVSSSGSEEAVEICQVEHKRGVKTEEIKGDVVVEGAPVLESEMSHGNDRRDEVVEGPVVLKSELSLGNDTWLHGNVVEVVKEDDREVSNCIQSEEGCIGHENVEVTETIERVELSEEQVQQLECQNERANEEDVVEVDNVLEEVEDGGVQDAKDDGLVKVAEKPLEHQNDMKVEESNQAAADTTGKRRIKQGRRCGLCGGWTDGKPPKKLAHNAGDSENEAYSSSASEEPNYDIWDGFGDEPGWLGHLLGPINDRYGIAGIWVHQNCAVWSPEVYFAGLGCLKNVRAALCRGRALKCSRCGRPGATIGCRVDRCPRTYHLPCARANGCIFDHRKFLIACTDHRHLFQPHGIQYLAQIKKMKGKKMKLEMRKVSNDAWRKDIEAEEKWLEHCGEDEEFLKRESKRLHRDLLRIAPVYIGGSESDGMKSFEGWESVAGLQDVIQCMKEVVILPLLYPEFFDNLGLTPPRGVLLHGYPGTGKTLVVRALIGSCARGDKRIAYFARKGADCLGKYVGDAERQLRLLFQIAERCQPSIIFFDEIDGLAPRRTRQQDQTHSSVVSTLLALLDGLKSRGSVVVIGATNRPDAVDPALRRPGRFDREIYFPLPSLEDRVAILELHTKKWPKPVTGSLLKWVARKTVGFAGADLQALCTQAAVIALKRNFPLQEILSAAEEKTPSAKRVPLPTVTVEERDWLEGLSCSPPPCSRQGAGMAANDLVASPLPTHLTPCLLEPLSTLLVSLHLDERLWLPPLLSKGGAVIESVIFSTLHDKRLPKDHWWSHVHDLLQEGEVIKEIERRLSCAGMLTGETSFADYDAFIGDISDCVAKFEPSIVRNGSTCSSLTQNTYFTSTRKMGFRILIAGSPRSGQKHLASCLLHCFIGNVEIQKVDLATIVQEGSGDFIHGVTQILMKCASMGSSVLFMPGIDLWAVETINQVAEESISSSTFHQAPMEEDPQLVEKENGSSLQQSELADTVVATATVQSVSHAWSLFVEQVESICVSTSLIILATSEVPHLELPDRIREFFKSDLQNCSQKTTLECTVPRFTVYVGRNFNHDMVIKLSAAELSRDILQTFVHLIHQRSHVHEDSKTKNFVQTYALAENDNTSHGLAGFESQSCGDLSVTVPAPPISSRNLKGKSSLILAISSFGYQILRYPHFAELCWVTSKLKEGPFADIVGPWKGWPFNSCIIRPTNSLDETGVACGSSSIKSKEKFGLVRGLVAVGLSAYRGLYMSLREVSSEVRKVLELLVRWINVKVNTGKDRYQYVRILSQVAYLEDMVNSWVYSLQSLDQDVQIKAQSPKPYASGSPDNHFTCVNDADQIKEYGPRSCYESEGLGANTKEFTMQNTDFIDLNKKDDYCAPNHTGKVKFFEEAPQGIGPIGNTTSEEHLNSSLANQLIVHVDEQNGRNPGLCGSESSRNPMVEGELTVQNIDCIDLNKMDDDCAFSHEGKIGPVEEIVENIISLSGNTTSVEHHNVSVASDPVLVDKQNGTKPGPSGSVSTRNPMLEGDLGSSKQSNRFAPRESVLFANGFCSSDELVGAKFSGSGKTCNQINASETEITITSEDGKPEDHEYKEDPNFPLSETALPAESGVICFYHCCSDCLHTLLSLMQKILLKEWKSDGCHWTVDDVHDTVALLSVDLLSTVMKVYAAGCSSNKLDENLRNEIHGKLSNRPEWGTCLCKSSENSLVIPTQCNCHSVGTTSPNIQVGFDPKFVYRDEVMVPIDSNKEVSFHCKFDTLCLCSLIESILMTKQPFD
ncbi:LOW QUALITY PROTEIN: uncharacterized protein LOC111301697 [Durio zibethinus]|uniref:LOW QUALITY PROTEIN: uncharacterized protein LOC111301697 n=1 Tax=Durio zibethinus TaxID=66656 RepID=A0A6P5ZLM9_DURZI|nr:LOW QUALITY PROTEIN: uncharacterized protein LOC111301697 [Durio zibethinus]